MTRSGARRDVSAAARLARLLIAEPALRELDLNPVVVLPHGQGALALDALMVLAE